MASVDVKQLLGWLEEGELTKAALRTWCRCQLLAEEAEAEGLVLININQTAPQLPNAGVRTTGFGDLI